jgi:hypothetical protein
MRPAMQEQRAASRPAAVLRRAVAGAALASLAMALTGCLSLRSNDASQTTPGKITIKAVVCASNYKHVGAPNWTDCQPGKTGKDILFDDNTREDAMTKSFGQILVGFRVPRNTIGPQAFASKDGTRFTLSPSYTTELHRLFAPSADQQWLGYISTVRDYDPANESNRVGELSVDFMLPTPTGGTPLATFRWRQVVGFRQGGNADAPVVCGDDPIGKFCVDSPRRAVVSDDLKTDVSDFAVLPGTSTTAYAGTIAVVPFTVRYADGAALGTKSFSLGASTELPQTAANTDPRTINADSNTSTRVTARVPIPANTPEGQYAVSLTAATGVPAITRSSTARIVVESVPLQASGAPPPSTNRAEVAFRVRSMGASGTRVRRLAVRKAPAAGTITVTCRGSGCAFRSKTIKRRRTATLTPLFRHRKLRPRTVVRIRVGAPNFIGKVFTFTVPKSERPPSTKVRCLPPGAKRALPCA